MSQVSQSSVGNIISDPYPIFFFQPARLSTHQPNMYCPKTFGSWAFRPLVLRRTARYVPKLKCGLKKRALGATFNAGSPGSGPTQMSADQLMQMLPSLPAQQQDLIRQVIETQGKDGLEKALSQALVPPDNEHQPGSEVAADDDVSSYEFGVNLLKQHLMESGLYENPQKHNKAFWKTFSDFSKLKPGPEDQPPFDLFAEIFEMAKLQPMPHIRPRCVKLVGDVIYSFNTVRMDPFNEVEYLDSLVAHGNTYRAIELWKSRRSKDDVKGSLYWLEVGALYYQESKNIRNAEVIAEEISNLFKGYVPPKVVIGFVSTYGQTRQLDKLNEWFEKLVTLTRNGVTRNKDLPSNGSAHIDQEEAYKMFNVPKSITEDELQVALRLLLDSRNWEKAAVLIDEMKASGIDISLDSTLATLDATTRRMVEYEPGAYSKRKRHQPAVESKKKLTVLISKLISEYPQLLENPKFYESWLRGLAGLEFYQNALMVVEAMINRGIKPSVNHMHTLIKALLAKNQQATALDLLQRMETRGPGSLYPPVSSSIYALFMQYGARRSNGEAVAEMVQRMKDHNCRHSTASFNTLMFYYYRHHDYQSIFDLYTTTVNQNGMNFFDQVNYRTLWLIFRDYYRELHVANVAANRGEQISVKTEQSTPPPNFREFFTSMIHSPKFKLSLNVYEYALHAFMLSRDYEAVGAVLCHLEEVNNIKLQGELVTSVFQLAHKLTTKTRFAFARPSKKDLLVQPGYSDPGSPSISWSDAVLKLCMVLRINEHEAQRLVAGSKELCELMNSESSSKNMGQIL